MKNTLVEISLVFKDDEDYKIEKVNAIKVDNYYQIKAVPAFAKNVAFDDIISASEEDNHLFFDKLIQTSGHSVVHIVILMPSILPVITHQLKSIGVNVNFLHDNLYLAVDIPKEVDYNRLKSLLLSEANRGTLDFREACISNQHKTHYN